MQTRNAENANTEARMHLIPDTYTLFMGLCNNVNMLRTIKTHLCNVFVLQHVDEK